jgi:hypothetical protein
MARGEASVALGPGRVRVYVNESRAKAERDSVGARSVAAGSPLRVATEVIEVKRPAPGATLCVRPFCDPVVAGVRWGGASGGDCSLGFYVGSPPGFGV